MSEANVCNFNRKLLQIAEKCITFAAENNTGDTALRDIPGENPPPTTIPRRGGEV